MRSTNLLGPTLANSLIAIQNLWIKIYPNPASSYVDIDIKDKMKGKDKVLLIDPTGRIMLDAL